MNLRSRETCIGRQGESCFAQRETGNQSNDATVHSQSKYVIQIIGSCYETLSSPLALW